MNRRQFLRVSAVAAAPLAASVCARGARTPDDPVVIVGAGLAGLRAAELLQQAGRPVVVLEAQTGGGGRVRTIRDPLDEALYGEAGAIRVPDMHRRVREMTARFGLSLIPFESGNGSPLLRVNGHTVRLPAESSRLGTILSLRRDEAGLSPRALLLKYVGEPPAGMDDPSVGPERYSEWSAIDRETWPAWLRSRGASDGAIRAMTAGGDSGELSALYVLRQFAMLRNVRQYFKIGDGMDQLPRRLADTVAALVRYGAAVVAVEEQPDRVMVAYIEGGVRRTMQADRVVFAIPFSTLREIEIPRGFSPAKTHAVRSLPYFPATRLLLQTKTRFWHTEGLSGTSRSDQPAETWDAAYDQAADRGLLAVTVGGALGREIGGLDLEHAVRRGTELAAETFPQMRTAFDKGVVWSWANEPWSRGAFAVFHPGQMSAIAGDIARPEGRIHFAGEHTSPWMGWMEGALESAERVAREVLSA